MKFAVIAVLGDRWGRLGYVVVMIKADLILGCIYLKVLMTLAKALVKSLWITGHSLCCGCNKLRCEQMQRSSVKMTKGTVSLTTQELT